VSRAVRVALAAGVAAAALLGAGLPAEAQCSMCRQVVTQSAEGQQMATELNRAILVMLAAPYLVFGSVLAAVFRGRLLGAVRARVRRVLGPR
jgi:hypothetical protein